MSKLKKQMIVLVMKHRVIAGVIIILLAVVLTLAFIMHNPTRDSELEKRFGQAIQEFRSNDAAALDLNLVLGTEWTIICLQQPYVLEEDFTRVIGKPLPKYTQLFDDENAFWVIYRDGTIRSARVRRGRDAMTERYGTALCTTPSDPFLYASHEKWQEHSWKAYHFSGGSK